MRDGRIAIELLVDFSLGVLNAVIRPVLLLLTTQGARELGMPLADYLQDAAAMARGQLALRERFGHDCVYGFSYGAAEAEAFGVETLFFDDGPPNSSFEVVSLQPGESGQGEGESSHHRRKLD